MMCVNEWAVVSVSHVPHVRQNTSLSGGGLTEAVGTRGGHVDGVIFHSDRGSQYTSGEYSGLCTEYRVTQSVGRTGVCWDNAPAESFFATLKKELVNRTTFRTHAEARIAIRHRIESWYNHRRLSSVIEYQTPIGWENHYRHNTQTLAA